MSAAISRERVLQRVEVEIAAGRLWRAREILGSAVAQFITDAVVLERYGMVLDQLGEKLLAGKFYFLSGVRRPGYAAAIAIFRSRTARGGTSNLLAQLPAAAKRAGLDTLPAVTVAELRALGVSDAELQRRLPARARQRQRAAESSQWVGILVLSAILFVFVAGVGATGYGLVRAVAWMLG